MSEDRENCMGKCFELRYHFVTKYSKLLVYLVMQLILIHECAKLVIDFAVVEGVFNLI